MSPAHAGEKGTEEDHRSAAARTDDVRAGSSRQPDAAEGGTGAPPAHTDPLRQAIGQTAGSRAFFHRLIRWFIPRSDAGSVVEKLVLLFSRVAVAVSTIGLLVGGWISMERYQARMAAKDAATPTATSRVGPAREEDARKAADERQGAQATDGSQAR